MVSEPVKHTETNSKENESDATGYEAFRASLSRAIPERIAAGEETNRYFQRPENWVALATLILVAAYTVLTYQQKNAALDKLATAQADQRPWIPTPRLFKTGPILMHGRPDPWVQFGIYIKNFGHSPASNITEAIEVQIVRKDRLFDSIPDEKRLCAKAASDSAFDKFQGKLLFPNDDDTDGVGGGSDPADIQNAWPRPNDISFRVIGCIDYTFANNPLIHGQTGFSYNVSRPIDNGAHRAGFDPGKGDVSPDDIAFDQDYFHAGYIR